MNQNFKKSRYFIPNYGIEESETGMLNWDFVEKEMTESKNYLPNYLPKKYANP